MSPVLVSLENVDAAFGTRTLLDQVSLGIGTGERIGVVGRNGAGKSTLLRIIAGEAEPHAGRAVLAGSTRVGSLAQADVLPADRTVREVVVGTGAEHEWAADPRRRGVLAGLGLLDRLDDVLGPMSGGERRRVALARLLVQDLDLLILDEPTNHLDVEGVAWLAAHLAGWRGGLLVATHDRWFLDEVCGRVWEVVDGRVDAYEGGYSAYVLARAERTRRADASEARRQNLLRKELAWLRRGPPARTSKPRFRIDAANALIADEPPPRDTMALRSFAASRLGKDVYDAENITVRIGERTLFDGITWLLGPGDRIGLVGVNGAGKTTLLRTLLGDVVPDGGRVKVGASVRPALLSQEVIELPASLRALEAVEQVGRSLEVERGRERSAGQLLEQFGLPSSRQWTRVGDLSGGERRRLQLLRLLMARPNVLFLDEPTNDLDTDTLTALEDLLDSWPGTLVVVSHDRYFLERTCDVTMALLGDGHLRMLPGGIEEYLARRAAAGSETATSAPPAPGAAVGGTGGAGGRGGAGGARIGETAPGVPASATAASGTAASATGTATGPSRSGSELRAARKELTRLERALDRLTRREQELHHALAEAATDHERLLALDAELRAVVADKDGTEEAWLTLAAELEG
ncbi:ATPase component of ABC transporters with duplicated ATPase domain [Frankia torreyi]|uniref:ATPase component of ABC transporters with duplicated ATPase domain n=2 Tax=Frankia TaxID=1854 RepID=A0A0D8BLU6_9ACTN|nr:MULTISPECIES: ABC-F family ATP-binding cassette domain-containing protein [Frankia]KJE24949.1 ATPase component of ABC transporters with duplicated ATPase domain [Frankia torreyi]